MTKGVKNSMKLGSISKLARDVEYTTDRNAFELRMRLQKTEERYIPLLWKIYKLIKMTDYAPERIQEILNRGVTYEDVAKRHGVTIGTIKRQVHNFSQKMVEIWGENDLIEMLRDGGDIDEEYLKEVELLVDDSIRNSNLIIESLEDKFSVNILDGVSINQDFSNIGREEFTILRNKLVSFSIPSQEFILKNTDKKLISYGIYLLITPEENLNAEDRARKKELISFTKIK